MKTFNSKYKGFCNTCHYTIWKNEIIKWNGKAHHVDCKKAILDDTPRDLDSQYARLAGKASKKKLRKKLSTASP